MADRTPILRRMRLRRADGQIYLDRWGIQLDRIGGIYLHRMAAPDPGNDLHDHPWVFASIVLAGGYTEERAHTRDAQILARFADRWTSCTRGDVQHRARLTVRTMRLDECHRITDLDGPTCWTLVLRGPRQRRWGFYTADGYVDERIYDETVRAERRDLWNEAG